MLICVSYSLGIGNLLIILIFYKLFFHLAFRILYWIFPYPFSIIFLPYALCLSGFTKIYTCLSSLLQKTDPFPLTNYFLYADHSQIIPTLMSSCNLQLNSSLWGHLTPSFQISSNIGWFFYKFHHSSLYSHCLLWSYLVDSKKRKGY